MTSNEIDTLKLKGMLSEPKRAVEAMNEVVENERLQFTLAIQRAFLAGVQFGLEFRE